jgi:hypothetical protein
MVFVSSLWYAICRKPFRGACVLTIDKGRFPFMKKTFAYDTLRTAAKAILAGVCLIALVAGCSSKPAQAPEAFIKDFMGKHITMLDTGLADYYVSSENQKVLHLVNSSIAAKREQGTLEAFKSARINLTGLDIQVLDRTDAYVNDEPRTYVKVRVTGTYQISYGDVSRKVDENETFILRASGGGWKVTETEDPWS